MVFLVGMELRKRYVEEKNSGEGDGEKKELLTTIVGMQVNAVLSTLVVVQSTSDFNKVYGIPTSYIMNRKGFGENTKYKGL